MAYKIPKNVSASDVLGSTTGVNPSAGVLGEIINANRASGSASALTTATPLTITNINLTSGIWDVSGVVTFIPTATTSITQQVGSISPTNNTLGPTMGLDNIINNYLVAITGIGFSIAIPKVRVTLSSPATYYLVASSTFTASTQTAYGSIAATRVG